MPTNIYGYRKPHIRLNHYWSGPPMFVVIHSFPPYSIRTKEQSNLVLGLMKMANEMSRRRYASFFA